MVGNNYPDEGQERKELENLLAEGHQIMADMRTKFRAATTAYKNITNFCEQILREPDFDRTIRDPKNIRHIEVLCKEGTRAINALVE